MKTFICVLFLVAVQATEYGNIYRYDNLHHAPFDKYHRQSHHRDHLSHIERPCHTHDVECIRDFLALNTGCTPVHGPAHDPMIKSIEMHVPHANCSITINNVLFKGLSSGRFEEFYINKKSDTLVLEVMFDSLVVESEKTVVTYYRKGKEPIDVTDYTIIEFKNFSLTLTIQHLHDKNRIKSHVYAFLTDKDIPFMAGPKLKDNKIAGLKYMNKWIDELDLTVQEAMVQQTELYMSLFLENQICTYKKH